MYDDVKQKFQSMIDNAETPMEKEFWQMATDLLDKFENLADDEAIRIDRDGESLYLWKGENSVQFVNTEEKKSGSKDIGEAITLAVLFIRDGDSTIAIVTKSEALEKKLEVMMS